MKLKSDLKRNDIINKNLLHLYEFSSLLKLVLPISVILFGKLLVTFFDVNKSDLSSASFHCSQTEV